MPYNNTPVVPPDAHTGVIYLPLARTKKIISADDDIAACSTNAAFAITVATEEFIYHLTRMTHNVVKSEKRRKAAQVTYNDVAKAVARVDNLEFLADVVPQTMTYAQYKKKVAEEQKSKPTANAAHGQQTLDQLTKTGQQPEKESELEDTGANSEDDLILNGHSDSHDQAITASAASPSSKTQRTAEGGHVSRRGQNYDAVRDDFTSKEDTDVSMDD